MTYVIYAEVSPVLKRNYIKLSQCLPQDTRKTIYKLMQMDSQQILKLPDGVLNHVGAFSSTKKINETIICILMARTRVDTTGLDFCDILECLVESENSRKAIQSIRNGITQHSDVNFMLVQLKLRYILYLGTSYKGGSRSWQRVGAQASSDPHH